ncbi:DUF551 domain-containing protein [Rhizobium leguminosarum]|uniref:DUF551 domain-containing protein n=1 Tax=Rhizobium leguminosarum TaxID=384 RepID=UPI00102FC1EF|nr:DUF551 domain-containing protein [Rhizobium leguminosarum]TAX57155.1 DUF551 domain-containing protein [Rhizobium leguminosarum]
MSNEIKPCPFCEGDPAPLDENNHTSCTNVACGSTAYMHVDAWNNRPTMEAYARIEELEAELGGWLPIDMAPTNGERVDIWLEPHDAFESGNAHRRANAYFQRGEWWFQGNRGHDVSASYHWRVTHFMPLPSPPTGAA